MSTAMFGGRLGPLAAMMGVGAAITVGAGVAAAEPANDGSSSVSRSAHSPSPTSSAAGVAAGTSQRSTGPTRGSSVSARTLRRSAFPPPQARNSLRRATMSPDSPQAPAPSLAQVVALTYSRGGPERLTAQPVVAAPLLSAQPINSQRVGDDPIAGFFTGLAAMFSNRRPTLNPTQRSQAGTGVISGVLNATDPDSNTLTFTVTENPARGVVVVHSDGSYNYTPNRAVAATGTTDSFRVSVSDAGSGFHLHGLSGLINLLTFGLVGDSGHTTAGTVPVTVVPFTPGNTAPAGIPVVNSPDPTTGVVTGAVIGSDADGDALTYSGSITTSKGAVIVTPAGTFTYTPTPVARENAAAPTATPADKADTFNVGITDGYGGTAAIPVTVSLVPVPTPPEPPETLAAFPGAEGFGSFATGGRGGSVIYVTNTDASGPGSLQWAIDQPGPKYILFKVSGLIDAQIHLTNGDATIAGQTSPGGITIRGFVTDETPYQDQTVRTPSDFAENWILQHVRIRPGANGASDDGLRLRYTRNAIVDHVSIGNATDEAVEISYSNDITVQNSVIAETLGGHSFYGGVLMNYSNPANGFELNNVALHHNIFNRIEGRLPEGSRESLAAANSTMNLELSNNLYWDPRFFIALGVSTNIVTDSRGNPYPIYWNINAVNNYFKTGAEFQYGMFDDQILGVARNQLYVSGNKMSRYPSRSDYELFYCCNDYPSIAQPDGTSRQAQALSTRHPFPAITYTPTDLLRTVLLDTAGAWPRDPMDTRLLQSVAQDTISTAPPNTNPANDAVLPAYSGTAPTAPPDTDDDGMPDAWEVAKGLDPDSSNTNATNLSVLGYTDLEVYLHELSASRIGPR